MLDGVMFAVSRILHAQTSHVINAKVKMLDIYEQSGKWTIALCESLSGELAIVWIDHNSGTCIVHTVFELWIF